MFDKNYKLLDAAWDGISTAANQVGATPVIPHEYMMQEYTIKEEGYVFMYVSNENATLVDVYFDDIVMTHTKSNVIQYNEYYPFGMQTANSWTRENTKGNNYLSNGGTELNTTTGVYDLHYRNYDPVLGRMTQVDPLADRYSSFSTYNFAFNDPVFWNDVSGADPIKDAEQAFEQASSRADREFNNLNKMYGVIGDDDLNGSDFSRYGPGGINSLQGFVYDPVTKRYVTQDFKNGEFGIWEDWSFVYYGEENLSGETWRLATVIKLLQWVPGSLNHYHTMSNRVTQKIHEGQQAFVDNPFGGGLLAFVSGGGLMGAGGSLLTSLGGRAIVGRMATQALTNLTTTGIRSAIINVGVQWYVKGSLSAVDIFDVTVSAFSGNAWVKAGIVQGLFDITSQEITNPFEKGLNKLAVDVVTQTLFNGANFGASAPLKIGPNSIYAFGVDGAFQLWGEIWNYQLNQTPSTKR